MEIRAATPEDVEAVQSVARASMQASYGHALDEDLIDDAVSQWYDLDEVTAELEDDSTVVVVAVEDGDVVGFAQSYVVTRRDRVGEIDWVHVHPEHRGRGIGTRLLQHVESVLRERDVARVEGRVLAENEAGVDFYEEHGYEQVGERRIRIGDGEFDERTFSTILEDDRPAEPALERREGPEGEPVYVALDETTRGNRGPFYAVYADEDRAERVGWLCGADDSYDIAMDTMERIECNTCGNRSKAARWDAAYL
jgi:ribosomal protein S18 acetylase RimI-like enzyme